MTLTLENITKTVGGETHIDDVSMTLEPGSFNVLLGRTLAGKTTLMKSVLGLMPVAAGEIAPVALAANADLGFANQRAADLQRLQAHLLQLGDGILVQHGAGLVDDLTVRK